MAADAAVGRLLLTHIPPWYDPQTVLAEAMGTFSGPLELARTDTCTTSDAGPAVLGETRTRFGPARYRRGMNSPLRADGRADDELRPIT